MRSMGSPFGSTPAPSTPACHAQTFSSYRSSTTPLVPFPPRGNVFAISHGLTALRALGKRSLAQILGAVLRREDPRKHEWPSSLGALAGNKGERRESLSTGRCTAHRAKEFSAGISACWLACLGRSRGSGSPLVCLLAPFGSGRPLFTLVVLSFLPFPLPIEGDEGSV